ncbi:MAG: FAD-dependent oxidoreductase [Clostridium sp.]|uniref:FAD-dependent oxidoreductase n=1 Tax=Clostridium sp. TaxID=1506 RepID=UPI003D6D54B4
MAQLRQKIVKLAKVVGGISGIINKIDENAPEYYSLAAVLTDEEADVAIAAGLRKERTAEYLAQKVGKPLEEVKEIAETLGFKGIFRVTTSPVDGKDRYYMQIFAPGIMEMMVNSKQILNEHPEVGKAFEEYTRIRMATMSPLMPDAYGLMRVVPVESSIKDLPGVNDYEKLSYYLDKYDLFSVSPCSCRSSRRIIGEGCGHLEEDMCVQMGKGAEYYIRTGRARKITREEALIIIKRAEENGLMHNMPNVEEAGESAAICNCCACACFGLRVGLLYGARDVIRSNFVAKIDETKCVACGQCVEICPGNALKLGQKISTKVPIPLPEKYRKLSNSLWHKSDWNVDYRENQQDVIATGTAPCKTACPAHIAVQGYLRLASQGDYQGALALIKKENPFPAVCGRICNHRCETECTRGLIDEAVAIDEVKRFIADHDLNKETRYIPPMINQIGRPYQQKIAIIGAGPAGMSCAFYLAEKGYKPTIFEKEHRLGGMLMNGIPSFRLEKDVVQAEIDILMEMGVEFKCGVEVGKDVTIAQLREQGYSGFYVAIGAQGGRSIGIAGEDAKGVESGISFICDVTLGIEKKLKGRTVVIGGGNVAVDVARTASRVGASETLMFCLEDRDHMPADADEVAEAVHEGIKVNNSWGPKEILVENGEIKGIVFKKCISVFDDEQRFAPKYEEDCLMTVECDHLLLSVGQSIVLGDLLSGTKVEFNRNGTVKADAVTYQTAEPDIFVGGDVYTGPKFAIDAIAAGKEAAISLHRWVQPGQTLTLGRDRRNYISLDKSNVSLEQNYDNTKRQQPGYNSAKKKTFSDTRVTFTEDQVKSETARCLACGATKVDEYMCVGCGLCTTKCKFEAIRLEKVRDLHAGAFETMPIKVAAHVVKKTGKIIAKPFTKG